MVLLPQTHATFQDIQNTTAAPKPAMRPQAPLSPAARMDQRSRSIRPTAPIGKSTILQFAFRDAQHRPGHRPSASSNAPAKSNVSVRTAGMTQEMAQNHCVVVLKRLVVNRLEGRRQFRTQSLAARPRIALPRTTIRSKQPFADPRRLRMAARIHPGSNSETGIQAGSRKQTPDG